MNSEKFANKLYCIAAGNWKQAYAYQQKAYHAWQMQIEADRDGAVSRLSVEYETAQKEARLAAQQTELALRAENSRIQLWFLGIVSVLLAIAGVLSGLFYRLSRKNRRISLRNAELVREQSHRVKNNFQVIASLLAVQSDRLTDPTARRAMTEGQLRIQTMALLQRKLYDGDRLVTVDLSEFIPELVGMVLRTFGFENLRPVYTLTPVQVSADQALPIGLILNELTTNACKYAFPDHPDPLFAVTLRQEGQKLTLDVADNGPGMTSAQQANWSDKISDGLSFGAKLIQSQVEQLRGISHFVANQGTHFSLWFINTPTLS